MMQMIDKPANWGLGHHTPLSFEVKPWTTSSMTVFIRITLGLASVGRLWLQRERFEITEPMGGPGSSGIVDADGTYFGSR